ncbi:4-hydroxy-tetrahydrodipicolinate synthase [Rhodococcus sp. ABRD24]|uniref:4-hydroxy-tetrahydrodipicolinate synthase n=1 Tax=Rhodococcus sp. ABRD24 TaxID=2507582 RepID=UPI00103E4D6F|nr:4-hydroxy-tetrahydrodipicolinate synthase [Rhodococcus sp. ABRD24]QBJ95264.1 4-hydroxy-tetrahydrodipicolinate synthase [Rhodococcus sp. ABRD24]
MTSSRESAVMLFGSNLVAMVTPMEADGSVSSEGVASLVEHLLATGCDGIVVGGTTGEISTLTADEVVDLVAAVAQQVRGRAKVIAGVGTYDTAGSIQRAGQVESAGADALLVVCPYYSRPTQAGVVAHCLAIADATDLPVMLYDVPARTGISLEMNTLTELAQHPRIRAVKDAKGDLFEAATVMADTSLAYYCGSDELNLPYLAIGASGVVSVVGNIVADRTADLIRAVASGDLESARSIDGSVRDLTETLMRTSQGAIMAKAALAELGIIPHATVRMPLLESQEQDLAKLGKALATHR